MRATDIAMDCSGEGLNDGFATANQPITCSVVVTDLYAPSQYTLSGVVTVGDGNGDSLQCTLGSVNDGCLVDFTAGLPVGTFTFTSSYPGDTTEFASSNGSDVVQVSAG